MLKFIPKLISSEDNKVLNKPITLEEVRLVVFNMNPDKSPGPDGFQAFFFQKCWDIIGEDLWKVIEALMNGQAILSKINHSFLTLIPKIEDPKTLKEFRPIALCNTIYKVLSKIIANRFKHIPPKIILEEWNIELPNRQVHSEPEIELHE